MNRKIIIYMLVILLGASSQVVGKNYEQLKGEVDSYTPSFYKSSMEQEQYLVSEPVDTSDVFGKKEKELAEIRARWDKLIQKAAEDKTFFDFESEQSRKIRGIALTEQIKEVLQKEITLEMLIAAAFERNPDLQSTRKEWTAALERYGQATNLDKIMRQYNAFTKELDLGTTVQPQKQMAKAQFPFPGTLSLKGNIITKEVYIARENYRIVLRDLISRIKLAYYELVYLGEAIKITGENLTLLKHFESTAFVRYKTGRAGYSDVVKVQVRIAKLDNDLITLNEERKTVIAKLNQLLNLSPDFALGTAQASVLQETSLSMEELCRVGLKNRQEIKRFKLEIERTNLAIELAEKKFFPDFTLGFSYFEDRATNLVGAAKQKEPFSLRPAGKTEFWFGKNEAYIREARVKYQAMQDQLSSLEDELRYMVKEQYFHFDTAKRNVVLYRDSLLKLAENALQVAETEYQSGKIDFLNVLDAQATWLDYNMSYHRSLRDQNQSVVKLEQTVGVVLE